MSTTALSDVYRAYIACLNSRAWERLQDFVHEDVHYNGVRVGLSGYRSMLENDVGQIADLHFDVQLLVADSTRVACRLDFHCAPKGMFMGLPVNGKKIRFTENVFYEYRDTKIGHVWSVIDKTAIEIQLRN